MGTKLLKVIIIVPYRLMSSPTIEKIDNELYYSREQKAVTATAIFKMKVKQIVEKTVEKHL